MSRTTNLVLLFILFNIVINVEGSEGGNIFNKISKAASKFKSRLVEFFYRFRQFFAKHSESTHYIMTSRGCGYAVDDEPMIYNKRGHIMSKIKGGDNVIWHTWPWMVALFRNIHETWSCAGVLVNEDTILTAAHCLFGRTPNEIKAIIGVQTVLGKYNPSNHYTIKSIHRHPDFENCCKNDIAVIKLEKSVLYGPKINSVCLPFNESFSIENEHDLVNRTATIIGWGESSKFVIKNFLKSFALQQADILIFDNEHCIRAYDSTFDPTTEICAGDYEHRTDTMSGDSGGPLLMRQPDGRWFVLGITSYGSAITPDTSPGVYAKVSAYQKWLEPYLKSN